MADQLTVPLTVRLGAAILEEGFTAVPNILLTTYAQMGISDGAFALVVHLLKFKWDDRNPYPRLAYLPTSSNRETRRRHLQNLRELGLIFTRQLRDDHGCTYAQEYDFESLFYNAIRANQLAHDDPFVVELPPAIVAKVATGYFDNVPEVIVTACIQHYAAEQDISPNLGTALRIPDFRVPEKRVPEERIPEKRIPEKRVLENRVGSKQNQQSRRNRIKTEAESEEQTDSKQNPPALAETAPPRAARRPPSAAADDDAVAADNDDADDAAVIEENPAVATALLAQGITRNAATAPLFASQTLTPDDVAQACAAAAEKAKNGTISNAVGLAIHWLLNGHIPPAPADAEDEDEARYRYIRGKYAAYVKH